MERSDPFWMRAVIIMLPALIAPLLAWLTSLRATSRRTSELDFLLRRIELVERVQKVHGETDAMSRSALDAELRDILEDLTELRGGEVGLYRSGAVPQRPLGWRSWLLTYKQSSRKGAAYKALFYMFVTLGTLGGISLLASGLEEGASGPNVLESIAIGLLGAGLYVVIGLAFRSAAVREHRKSAQKRSTPLPAAAANA